MTVRGGGFPTGPLALMPIGRMGPPLRSFAADAHDCIVVWSLDLPNTRLWRDYTALESGLPSDRHPDRTKRRHCARGRSRRGLKSVVRTKPGSGRRNGLSHPTKKRVMEKDALPCLNFLTKKAPYKGLCADSVEKHEPASDADAAVVDGLKALDPNRPTLQQKCRVMEWSGRAPALAIKAGPGAPKTRSMPWPTRRRIAGTPIAQAQAPATCAF
jgi:hypothetical protein